MGLNPCFLQETAQQNPNLTVIPTVKAF
uniref:Uncharacterized protein n=1 Tax=Rhizophora mucronata TaxID=61149 RepID=A0A2P2P815_RHIMU